MTTFIDAVKLAGKRAFCTVQSAGYNAWYLFSKLTDGDILAAGKFSDASGGLFCNNPVPPTLGNAPVPFLGGQCPIAYLVNFNATVERVVACGVTEPPQTVNGSFNTAIYGPITYAGPARFFTPNTGCPDEPLANLEVAGYTESGSPTSIYQVVNSTFNKLISANSFEFVPRDGGTDNCGDPPPSVPPYEPGSTTIVDEIIYQPEGGGPEITVPATVILGFAYIDANANIRIPVSVNLGGIKIPLTLNVTTGDINLGGIRVGSPDVDFKFDIRIGGPSVITVPPGTEPPIGPPPTEPDYPEITEPPESDSDPIIIGAVVTTSNVVGRRDLLYQGGGNPNIEIPRLGFINFLNYVPGLGLAWSEDIPIKNLRHLVQNPWPYGAIAVEGSPRNGVTWTITPIYKQAQLPIEYPDLVSI